MVGSGRGQEHLPERTGFAFGIAKPLVPIGFELETPQRGGVRSCPPRRRSRGWSPSRQARPDNSHELGREGTGKTLVGRWHAEASEARRVLVLRDLAQISVHRRLT